MSNRILTERPRSWPPVRRAVTREPCGADATILEIARRVPTSWGNRGVPGRDCTPKTPEAGRNEPAKETAADRPKHATSYSSTTTRPLTKPSPGGG